MNPAPDPRPPAAPGPASPAETARLTATVARLRGELRAAGADADRRALLGLAAGILVARLECTPAQAAERIAALADAAGIPPAELAADIVGRDVPGTAAEAVPEDVPAPERLAARARLWGAEAAAATASDADDAARAVLENAMAPLGAAAVALWHVQADGALRLAGQAGLPAGEAARWRHVPPGVATLAGRAVAEGEAVIGRGAALGPAAAGPAAPRAPSAATAGRVPSGVRMAAPAFAGGRIAGVLEVCWPEAAAPGAERSAPPPDVVRQVAAMADVAARAVPAPAHPAPPAAGAAADVADVLPCPAVVLLPVRAEEPADVDDFVVDHANRHFADPSGRPWPELRGARLTEAYPPAAEPGRLLDLARRAYRTGTPATLRLAPPAPGTDTGPDVAVWTVGEAVVVSWLPVEDRAGRLADLVAEAQRMVSVGGFEENLGTGDVLWTDEVYALFGLPDDARPLGLRQLPAHVHPDDGTVVARFLRTVLDHGRPASAVLRLLRPDGAVRHTRIVAAPSPGTPEDTGVRVRGAYEDVTAEYGTAVALAATRERLDEAEEESAARNRLARQLQEAIMPTDAEAGTGGLRVAVRYRPAQADAAVGGDWYDTVELPDGSVLLCVGDIAGHGIAAATGMIVLRNALRGLAMACSDPARLMHWLNAVACHPLGAVTATAVCAVYDPRSHTLTWARAGHLPPLWVHGDRAEPLPLVDGPMLGAFPEAEYDEQRIALAPGDTLVMYTDGLVERRGSSVSDGVARLAALLPRRTRGPEELLDRLLALGNADTDDDTCVIAAQVPE
ncbi:SpoIIE family protein phosphatase [Uniformispora flossi]|uniref:SpoIIE family protein phosphatase n=1 Tax=Uniformispora flossi TaxID=3390723 RepID=UPI003C2D1C89